MSSTARLGAFILVALAMFGAMVFLIGDKQLLFSRTYHIRTPFENVAGLDEGAPVRAGGVRIGTVQSIELPRQPEDKIMIEVELENSTRDVIKKDSIASIQTEGLLGNKYLAISFGSPQGEQLRDGDTIESRPPIDYGDVAKKASEMLDSAKEAVDSSKVAIGNINDASGDMKSIAGKINRGQGTIGALVNDRTVYRNLNEMVQEAEAGATSFQENMEALKHNFFLRGFFKKRGYYDSSELTKNAVAKLPARAPVKQFSFDGKAVFAKTDTAKLTNEKVLKEVGSFLESNPHGIAVVAAQSGAKGTKEENLKLSQARAMVVRQYLAKKFKVDDAWIRTMGMGEDSQTAGDGGRLTISVYPGSQENGVVASAASGRKDKAGANR
jgi:phospholipid/cholesterol/gamma-HCH transport system substrate-binding protein